MDAKSVNQKYSPGGTTDAYSDKSKVQPWRYHGRIQCRFKGTDLAVPWTPTVSIGNTALAVKWTPMVSNQKYSSSGTRDANTVRSDRPGCFMAVNSIESEVAYSTGGAMDANRVESEVQPWWYNGRQ